MRKVSMLLSLILVFIIPWENAITVRDLGTLARIIGVLLAMFWLASALVSGVFRKPHLFHFIVFLFILWNVASLYWSIGFDQTVQRIKTYLQLAIMNWILWDLYKTPKALGAILQSYILGAYVTICSSIYNYFFGRIISEYAHGRYAGGGMNAVDQTLILALGLPVAWHLATAFRYGVKNHFLSFINYAYIPLSLFSIILTGSRTSLFVIVPPLLYILVTAKRLKPVFRIMLFTFFIISLLSVYRYIPESTVNRLATISDTITTLDLGGRVGLWTKSIEIFSEHPLLGIGSGAIPTISQIGEVTHNTFISVLAELGLIGFTLFFTMLLIVAHQAVNQPKQLSGLWLIIFVIWVIGVFSLTWEYRKPTWLFLNLIVISANLYRNREYNPFVLYYTAS